MEEIAKLVTQMGVTGTIVVVLIYDVFILQKKLVDIIERNTKALAELQTIVAILQETINRHRFTDK